MAAVLSSSSPSFCPLSSRAIRARARSPTTPEAAPFMPSMPPWPGMCWARLRDALPAPVSPTAKDKERNTKSVLINTDVRVQKTGDAVGSAHLHNVRPEHEGGLRDVVFVDARLGGHGHHLGLFLRTQHGELGVRTVLRRGRGGRPAPPALLLLLVRGVRVVPRLVGRGQQSSSGVQQGHEQLNFSPQGETPTGCCSLWSPPGGRLRATISTVPWVVPTSTQGPTATSFFLG
ncbi:hypothetical protein EYF80_011504 [Liparis tanakae]|uniref:Uncharacterized protein n=1 Tax=Liparis tanakae TaxID=230148 RepID=A0A4Z2ILC4_9TELE|nr:hypothetical protein EYF80_011504 [Liparis tanakae]